MELRLPPALVEALIAREREFNAALVSLTATIDGMFDSGAGDLAPRPQARPLGPAAPERVSGLSARNPA
jgi:hypothetical protein